MVPGTGCSVIGNALIESLGGRWIPERDVVANSRVIHGRKHNTVRQLIADGYLTREESDDLLVFAAVRNPFDRFVTYYQRLVGEWTDDYFAWTLRDLERERPSMTEEEYAERLLQRERMIERKRKRQSIIRRLGFNNWLKVSLLRHRFHPRTNNGRKASKEFAFPMLDGADVAIRYEYLEAGLNEVLKRAGVLERISLPLKNVTPGKRAHSEYYSRSTRLMAEAILRRDLEFFSYDFEGPTAHDHVIDLK